MPYRAVINIHSGCYICYSITILAKLTECNVRANIAIYPYVQLMLLCLCTASAAR